MEIYSLDNSEGRHKYPFVICEQYVKKFFMELYQLKTFAVVARTCSVTRAAEQLFTTPPSVSNHIRQLEENLGVTLFTRTPKGMFITSQGGKLLTAAQGILDKEKELYLLAEQAKKQISGSVLLGINSDPEFLRVSDIVDRVYKDYPGIRLEVVPSSTGEIIDCVEKGDMTCGYAFGPVKENGITALFLSEVDLVIGIPAKQYKKMQTAPLKNLAGLPWIVPENNCPSLKVVQSYMADLGIELADRVFANDDITKNTLVKKGAAVCVLERSEALPFVESGSIVLWQGPDKFTSTLSFVYPASAAQDLIIKTMISIVNSVWGISPA